MITAQVESLTAMLPELQPVFPEHYRELALDQDHVPLDPQYDEYLRRDAAGMIMLVTLRDRGELIGYFVGFVAPGLHYRTTLTLTMDIFYVRRDHRGNGAGFVLFRAVEAEAKRRGVQRMLVGSKCHKEASWLFERLGYDRIEVYYSKWLGLENAPASVEEEAA
jgi:GNAT superfamily N-acetyltransferase